MAIVAFQTDVEVLRDVPLCARRDAVVAPVARTRTAVCYCADTIRTDDTKVVDVQAHLGGRITAVADIGVGANERSAQARCRARPAAPMPSAQLDGPEGQIGLQCDVAADGTAVRRAREPTHTQRVAPLKIPGLSPEGAAYRVAPTV
jgi:hypothetical protein